MEIIRNDETTFEKVSKFLETNIIYRIKDTKINDEEFIELDSIRQDKLLVSKNNLDFNVFMIIIDRFNNHRKMLFDQDSKKVILLELKTKQDSAEIIINSYKCNVIFCTSKDDLNILTPVDENYLMDILKVIDNGKEPMIRITESGEFVLTLGPTLTIKFDRVLLKYIEEFAVNCKFNNKNKVVLERKM